VLFDGGDGGDEELEEDMPARQEGFSSARSMRRNPLCFSWCAVFPVVVRCCVRLRLCRRRPILAGGWCLPHLQQRREVWGLPAALWVPAPVDHSPVT
jgi:hypothetical protein